MQPTMAAMSDAFCGGMWDCKRLVATPCQAQRRGGGGMPATAQQGARQLQGSNEMMSSQPLRGGAIAHDCLM